MKEDLRIIKTKKALRESLVTLIKEKQFEKISVMEICERALVNRVTFYSHYKDKIELFQDLIIDVTLRLVNKCLVIDKSITLEENLIRFIERIFHSFLSENSLKAITSDVLKDNIYFVYGSQREVFNIIREETINIFKEVKLRYPLEYVITFILGGLTSIVRLQNVESPRDPMTFEKIVQNLVKEIATLIVY